MAGSENPPPYYLDETHQVGKFVTHLAQDVRVGLSVVALDVAGRILTSAHNFRELAREVLNQFDSSDGTW